MRIASFFAILLFLSVSSLKADIVEPLSIFLDKNEIPLSVVSGATPPDFVGATGTYPVSEISVSEKDAVEILFHSDPEHYNYTGRLVKGVPSGMIAPYAKIFISDLNKIVFTDEPISVYRDLTHTVEEHLFAAQKVDLHRMTSKKKTFYEGKPVTIETNFLAYSWRDWRGDMLFVLRISFHPYFKGQKDTSQLALSIAEMFQARSLPKATPRTAATSFKPPQKTGPKSVIEADRNDR